MGKSTSGPDWVDVRAYMKSIELTHACWCYLSIAPDGWREGSGLRLNACAVGMEPSAELTPQVSALEVHWPNADGRSFVAEAYNICHLLDSHLSKTWYVQRKLPDA